MATICNICLFVSISIASVASWCGEVIKNLPVYPHSKVVESFDGGRSYHLLVASAMKKVNGAIKADKELRLDGFLSRKLYLLPDENAHFAANDLYTSYFESQGVKPLYKCQSFKCGDSNYWANNVFNIPELFGLDNQQGYFIGEKEISGKTVYFSVYTVQRGNKRSYALVDVFESDEQVVEKTAFSEDNLHDGLVKNINIDISAETEEESAKKIHDILSNHISSEFIIYLTSPEPPSLRSFDKDRMKAEKQLITIKQKLANLNVNKRQFRLIYSGINKDILSNLQLKIVQIR